MTPPPTALRRRTFGSLLAGALPATVAVGAGGCDLRDLFVRDVARSYEDQLIGFDMEDVDAVFRAVRHPRLACALASGAGRAAHAAASAVEQAGGAGASTLVIVSVRPGERSLRESRDAMNAVRAAAAPDATVIYGARIDPDLPAGTLRVSLLTG